MKIKNRILYIVIIMGFLGTLYWVEMSPWGSQAVALYNNGYGTFDMKTYDVNTVETVLRNMKDEGFRVSFNYYIGDYLFVFFFGATQALISCRIYRNWKKTSHLKQRMFGLSIGIVILRGIADVIENTLLFVTIYRYPAIQNGIITTAGICTQVKLWCIRIWIVTILLGMIMKGMEHMATYRKARIDVNGKTKG